MTKPFLSLIISALVLQGCLMHYFVETESRVQITNRSTHTIDALQIIAINNSAPPILLVVDTLRPDSISWVRPTEYTGTFNLAIHVFDSTVALDTIVSLGSYELNAGAARFDFVWPTNETPVLLSK